MLGTTILALDNDPAWDVHDAHCGVRLIDVLTTGARRSERVNAQVCRVDRDVLDRVGFGENRHSARARVDAALRFGRGHALHAVRPGFKLQFRVRALTDDACDHLAIAA